MLCSVGVPGRLALFWAEMGRSAERAGMGELTEAEGRLCVQDISYKRKIKKLKRRLIPTHVLWTYLHFYVSELTL